MSIGIAKYLYKLRTNSKENIYNFEKNPFKDLKNQLQNQHNFGRWWA